MFGTCSDPNCPHEDKVKELQQEVARLQNVMGDLLNTIFDITTKDDGLCHCESCEEIRG